MDTNVLLPLATLILGYVGRMFSEHLQDKRVASREREAREAERERKRKDFQRDTLLELQEVMLQFGRAVGASHMADVRAHRSTGVWGKQPIGEWSERLREANARLTILVARVADDELRRLVKLMTQYGNKVTDAKSEDEAWNNFGDSLMYHEIANARLGELLRSLY